MSHYEPEKLAAAVRAKREREGLSLRDAALASGVAFSTLGRIEKGAEPSLRVYKQIVAWLDGATPTLPLPPMSLRDWFAGQALTGLAAAIQGPGCAEWDYYSGAAFHIADAMLEARATQGGPNDD